MSALVAAPKPRPVPIVETQLAPPGYLELCKSLGIGEPAASLESRVLEAMRGLKIPRYDQSDVDAYMDGLARVAREPWVWATLVAGRRSLVSPTNDGRWISMPRTRPHWALFLAGLVPAVALLIWGIALCKAFGPWGTVPVFLGIAAIVGCACGAIWSGDETRWLRVGRFRSSQSYTRPVPAEFLARADLLRQRFPELGFYVTDYEVPNPDPFICCTTDGSWHVVFGVWDEPGFGG